MKRTIAVGVTVFTVAVMLGIFADQTLSAQHTKRTVLQRVDLGDRDAIMALAEGSPGVVGGKHYHPGHEFVYVLEGSWIIEADGMSPVTLNAGDHFHQPPQRVHRGMNASNTAPAKILVFLVAEKGQPESVPVK